MQVTLRLEFYEVPSTGFEPAQPYGHHPLKMACLPISPTGHLMGAQNRIRTCTPFGAAA